MDHQRWHLQQLRLLSSVDVKVLAEKPLDRSAVRGPAEKFTEDFLADTTARIRIRIEIQHVEEQLAHRVVIPVVLKGIVHTLETAAQFRIEVCEVCVGAGQHQA